MAKNKPKPIYFIRLQLIREGLSGEARPTKGRDIFFSTEGTTKKAFDALTDLLSAWRDKYGPY